MSLLPTHSYSHTHHVVPVEQFDRYVSDLLTSDTLDAEKKSKLNSLMQKDIMQELRQSNYWRHNIVNGGLSGPFTEYFATFDISRKYDFWGDEVQPIDRTYLSECALPRAYQATIAKTQEVLARHVKELVRTDPKRKVAIASLACGTMYDVLGAKYETLKPITFYGFDVDSDSLKLAQEKAEGLEYGAQIELRECDVVETPLGEDRFDIVVCNGFSFYISDVKLLDLIGKVKSALKPSGIFLMSFIQPSKHWKMSESEATIGKVVGEIFDTFPMHWSANFRTADEVIALLKQGGLRDVSVFDEEHDIHPLATGHKV